MGLGNGDLAVLSNDEISVFELYSNGIKSTKKIKSLGSGDKGELIVYIALDGIKVVSDPLKSRSSGKLELQKYPITDKNITTNYDKNLIRLKQNLTHAKEVRIEKDEIVLTGIFGVMQITRDNPQEITINAFGKRLFSSDIANTGKEYWLGTKNGLQFGDERVSDILNGDSNSTILEAPVNVVKVISDSLVWVGTDGLGAFLIYNQKVYPISETRDWIVTDILIDPQSNRVYVASNFGVGIISNHLQNEFSYNFQILNAANGLPSNEVTCLEVAANFIYAGTTFGLAKVDKKIFLTSNTNVPKLLIEEVNINGNNVEIRNRFTLKYKEKIEINFAGISYESGNDLKYYYRLTKSDDWHQTFNRDLELPALSKGTYPIEIKVSDAFGNDSEIEKVIVKMSPPWWNTIWAKGIVIVLIGIGLWARFRSIRKNARNQIDINNKIAGLELQALQSQMNPHFVFNLMNSFQRIVLTGDFLKVNEYITSFSRLMRLFLESSREKYITIQHEEELLTEYLKLEKLRYKDKFEFQISSTAIVDKSHKIPSMMIQPFVENSINHGIKYLKGAGKIDIHFIQIDSKNYQVIVEDNGVGIEKAKEIASKSSHKHKSRGLEIINDRIDTLKKNDSFAIDIDISDKSALKIGQGTKVVVNFKKLL